ncbi:hypothetical protein PYH55_02265 [Staphylococcus epidermidis]|nr:hypothetical protein PYH55_02265 [Staphylococcus epidermidis]
MKLKNAPNDLQSMSQDGDAILRSLQNKSLPIIDLMVRESLQNSLDATLPKVENTIVEFNYGTFNSKELAEKLEGVTDNLKYFYKNEEKFISISDKNTYGLTGDFKSSDPTELNKSNFHKLVFGIGKNQEADGAGGSWGLGKTSYFRLGNGIVIYYTRIKTENGFEERLIASLIESPKQNKRLLPKNVRGIAWWGEFDKNNNDSNNAIYPITDEYCIKKFLKIFDIKPYSKNETGTTIIIPYIKENEDNSDDIRLLPWELDKEIGLKLAVQRWYNPRLNNKYYSKEIGNSQLLTKVNGEEIIKGINTEPLFDIMQDLYTSALKQSPIDNSINVRPILLQRNAMKNPKNVPVGHIAFKEVSKEELKMLPPENRFSPLEYIGIKDEKKIRDNSSKIIAYSRKPGMVVEYDVDGEWTPRTNLLSENNILLGFFVPNSQGELTDKYISEGYTNLEQYLRATENADHANWIDEDGFGIIRRIKATTSKEIANFYQGDIDDKQSSTTTGLSRKFGKLLLPPKNYGRTSSFKSSRNTVDDDVISKNRISDIKVIHSNPINQHEVEVDFKAFIKEKSSNIVFLQVLSQDKKLNKSDWIKTMGDSVQFPFEFIDIDIISINNKNMKDSEINRLKEPKVYLGESEKNEFYIDTKNRVEIEGKIKIYSLTTQFVPNLAISSKSISEGKE